MTQILDGRQVARELEADLRQRVRALANRDSLPGLCVVLFGDDSPSRVYGTMIRKGCERIGVSFRLLEPGAGTTLARAEAAIDALNADPRVHGILIKRPLPGALADEAILQRTLPRKDVDGYHFENVGRLVVGGAAAAPVPCTPAGVLELLRRSGHFLNGRHVVVLGRSATVGKPLANLLAQKEPWANATVTLCHRGTVDLASHTQRADVVVTAVGVPGFLTPAMVRPDAVVIDVGTNVVPDAAAAKGYRLVGDADFDGLLGRCAAITPVPGGVGPVTVAMLLTNVVAAAERARAAAAS